MIFILKVRITDDGDICISTRTVPEPDDYEMYFAAFCEELRRIDGVTLVRTISGMFEVVIDSQMTGSELQKALRPAFSTSAGENVRFVALTEAESSGVSELRPTPRTPRSS